ncbi:MAG TPA: transcriptional regulator [Methylocella sp.]|nr:transcriptional regulator [Methylocella sp.]
MISSKQCRAARALLGWSPDELASKSHLPLSAIETLEEGAGSPHAAESEALRRIFELAGIKFLAKDDGGIGVQLRNEDHREAVSTSITVDLLTAENDE